MICGSYKAALSPCSSPVFVVVRPFLGVVIWGVHPRLVSASFTPAHGAGTEWAARPELRFVLVGIPGAGLWCLLCSILAIARLGGPPILGPAALYMQFTADPLVAIPFAIGCQEPRDASCVRVARAIPWRNSRGIRRIFCATPCTRSRAVLLPGDGIRATGGISGRTDRVRSTAATPGVGTGRVHTEPSRRRAARGVRCMAS